MTWPPYSAARQSLAQIEAVLAREPHDISALFSRACLLDRLADTDNARQAYLDVLAQDMTHVGALARLGKLLAAAGYTSAALTAFRQGVAAHPEDATTRVLLANMLRQAGQNDQAAQEYRAALHLDPEFAPAHQGLSYLLDGIDEAAAAHHRRLGFSGHALTTSDYRGKAPPIDVLRIVSARGGNIDLNAILDDRIFRTHTLVVEHAAPGMALPPHVVTINAIGDADRCADALAAATELLANDTAPVLNPPERIVPTGRQVMSSRLAALEDVITARIALVDRAALQAGLPDGFRFPALLRSPGYHTGEHFCRVSDRAAWAETLAAIPGDTVLVIEDLNPVSPDGAFRKFRAMIIGGKVLPLHLAISTDWKVHYFTASMAEQPAFRAEEARFLDNMDAVIGPHAIAGLARVGAMLGLDYAGIDFALAPDGRLIVFEANATMVIANPPIEPMWRYRLPAAANCLNAAQQLIKRAAATP